MNSAYEVEKELISDLRSSVPESVAISWRSKVGGMVIKKATNYLCGGMCLIRRTPSGDSFITFFVWNNCLHENLD